MTDDEVMQKLERLDQLRGTPDLSPSGIASYLEDPDPRVRLLAVDLLGEIAAPAEGQRLLRHLNDPNPVVRADVVQLLGNIRFGPAAEALIHILGTDRDSFVRVCAAEALGDIRVATAPVFEALTAALARDRSPLVRAYAAESLSLLGYSEAIPHIRHRLQREHSTRARASELAALYRLGDPIALHSLLRMLRRTKDWATRRAVANILLEIRSPENRETIRRAVDEVIAKDESFPIEHPEFMEIFSQEDIHDSE